MNRALLNLLPSWLIILVFVAGGMLFSYVVFRLVSRAFRDMLGGEQNEVTTLSVEIIGAMYGIVLGFIIVALWEDFDAAEQTVSAEATALSQIVRASAALDPAADHAIRDAAGQYVRAVTEDEWPAMREGRPSTEAADAMNNLYLVVQQHAPVDDRQAIFYEEVLTHLDDALSARRARLDTVDSTLPGAIQFMMYAGFGAIMSFMALVGSARPRMQMLLLLGVTAIIAFNLALAVTLDYPFSGDTAVSDGAFHRGVLAQFYE